MKRQTKIWSDAPKLAMPNDPALVSDCSNAWISYETASDEEGIYAVVHFGGLIDIHLSPINDEGLASHPYAALGIRCYEFNELFGTSETKRWESLAIRHFAITFKEVTSDVLARTASVIAKELRSRSAGAALSHAIQYAQRDGG